MLRIKDNVARFSKEETGGFYRSMQHLLRNDLFKDGVYERRETVETFFHAEN